MPASRCSPASWARGDRLPSRWSDGPSTSQVARPVLRRMLANACATLVLLALVLLALLALALFVLVMVLVFSLLLPPVLAQISASMIGGLRGGADGIQCC